MFGTKIFKTIIRGFLSLGFVGYIPFAPGTFGTILTLLVWYIISLYFSLYSLFFLGCFWILITTFFSIYGINLLNLRKKDQSWIVIDESIGITVTLLFLWGLNINTSLSWCLAFLFFRFFDIIKPFGIKYIDKKNTSSSVIMDDIIAGIYSGILLLPFVLLYF